MHKAGTDACPKKIPGRAKLLSRRKALSGIVLAAAAGLARGARSVIAPANAAAAENPPAQPARPLDHAYEILEVGPGKKFPSLTLAGCYMNGISRWNNGYAGADIANMGFRVIVSPGPSGYYTNDSGSHSRRWPQMVGWPPYEGNLLGPVVIEGEPGKPAPVLETDGAGDGVLYYQTGLFSTGSCDATFRHLVFRGFRRHDGEGNYAAVRLGQDFAKIPMNSHVLFEDCDISNCDNGILGGAKGQSLTLRRCFIHENGNGTGRAHNVYFGYGDLLTVEDTLSTKAVIGHLLKSRAARTVIRNTRLIGDGGTESACLDVPDAGILDIDGLVCEKSPGTDAGWIIHYSGENQDSAGAPFHAQSSIKIRNLVMVAPPRMIRYPKAGPMQGFVNQSGQGADASGKGSFLVQADAQNVKVFGLSDGQVGLPHTMLAAKPVLDLKSPIREQA
jgi:hypothetical protein